VREKRKKEFWAGDMAQVVECLPSKHKALISNSRITTEKKNSLN
jgi:hypothetical protein